MQQDGDGNWGVQQNKRSGVYAGVLVLGHLDPAIPTSPDQASKSALNICPAEPCLKIGRRDSRKCGSQVCGPHLASLQALSVARHAVVYALAHKAVEKGEGGRYMG